MTTEGGRKGNKEKEMTFLEHLEELRWHIIRSVLAICIMAVLAFFFKDIIFDKIILAVREPGFLTNRLLCRLGELVNVKVLCINNKPFDIINIKMAGQFITHISISLISGVILASPYILWEFWKFFRPALYTNEYLYARGAVLSSSLLFITGVLFGYFVIAPLSIHFLSSYSVSEQVNNQIFLRSYIGTISSVSLATGIVFELPIVIYFLSRIGIVSPRFLRKYRKHALIINLTVSAIITPPDVFSQILVSIPLLILYEAGILISAGVEKQKIAEDKKREAELSSMRNENSAL